MIMTHRHLDDVFPSLGSLLWTYMNIYIDENDAIARNTLIFRTIQYVDKSIERTVEFRTRPQQS